jgi:SSS family solute:Na+ symporter
MLFTAWTILSSRLLLPDSLSFPFDLYYTGLIGNIIMFILAFGLSFILLSKKPDRGLSLMS